MLFHRQQPGQVGCLYYSLFALLGHEPVLAHADDLSDVRFSVRLAELGLLPFPLWITPSTGPTADAAFWEAQRQHFTDLNGSEQAHVPLLVSIMGTAPPWLHSVALTLPISPDENRVQISDSNFSEPFTIPWAAFLVSDYARAHRVEMLGPLDLDAYPPDHRTP